MQPRPPLAAYIVGHDSVTLRIWQMLFRGMPEEEWGTFDGVPLSIDHIRSAMLQLGPFLAPAVPSLVQPILADLRNLNDRLIDAFSDPQSPSAALLEVPNLGKQLWSDLCNALSPAVLCNQVLSLWLSFGRTVG